MVDILLKHMSQFISFTPGEQSIVKNAFTPREVPRKTRLAEEGKVAKELYFIQEGLIRLYYLKEGTEITGFIFRENHFASSYDSFLSQSPGVQILETVEDCKLLVITYSRLQKLYDELPKMHIVARKVAEQRFINAQAMLSSYIMDKPEERYRKFMEKQPDLLLRVPHHMIASYLGITAVSLSRIRKRLMK